jgi:adenine-specific DNA-methyltransferase
MIYIDPPYNTGKDFVYKDDFRDNIENYKQQTGQEGQSNPETAGRYHTNWLNMMYPRLRLAKNLLRDDGVIFISIDDSEVANLRKIADEVFGEWNLLTQLIHQRAKGGGQAKQVVRGHDYILAYAKNAESGLELRRAKVVQQGVVIRDGKEYLRNDDVIRKTFGKYDKSLGDRRCFYEELEQYKGPEKKKEIDDRISRSELVLEEQGDKHVIVEYIPVDDASSKLYSIIKVLSEEGTYDLESLGIVGFDYPKPVELVSQLIQAATLISKSNDDIILDFFAGSGTTAHATMELNAEDGGNRRFIMVQLPELTPEDSEAWKAGYKTIAEIGRERIRRAGEKIKADYAEKLAEREKLLDVGFKAFTLDSTNFREWDSDTTDITKTIAMALQTFKDGRTTEDALYEILLKYGVDISEPVQVQVLAGVQVYSLAGNYLLVCLEKKIPLAMVEEMAKLKPSRVVFYDNGFESDEAKQNALETLQRAGVEDVRTI